MRPFQPREDVSPVADERLDALVSEWLHTTAARLPAGVLDEVLTVAPTVRRARRPLPKAVRRPLSFAPLGALAAALVLAVAFGPGIVARLNGLGPPGPGPSGSPYTLIWDVAKDFREESGHQNPSADWYGHADVWAYEYSVGDAHDPASYRLLPEFDDYAAYGEPGSGVTVATNNGRALGLTPATTPGRHEPAIISWRSPIDGPVHVVGQVIVSRDCDSGSGILFSVAKGPTPLLSYTIEEYGARGFGLDTTLQENDHLYFIVESGADPECDWTTLYLTIVAA